jgi:hypothetical protein
MNRQTTELFRLADYRAKRKTVYFNRLELNQLLAVYSRHVIRGEWRDYAIDHRDGFALFSPFAGKPGLQHHEMRRRRRPPGRFRRP